jgi:hypothetical protein
MYKTIQVRFPIGVVFFTFAIALIGVINLYSAAANFRANLFAVQCGWLILGFSFCIATSLIHTRIIYRWSYLLYWL